MKRLTLKISKFTFFYGLLIIASFLACGGDTSPQDIDTPKERVNKKPATKKAKTLGERMFIMCAACHNVKKGAPHKVGPNLHGLFGAKAGMKEGYKYSEAMKTSGIVWNEDHLRNWLKKPTDYIPGTTMAFIGIQKEDQQTALIEYLKEETK